MNRAQTRRARAASSSGNPVPPVAGTTSMSPGVGRALTTQLLAQEATRGGVLGSRGGLRLAELPLGPVLQVEVPESAGQASPHLRPMKPFARRAREEEPARWPLRARSMRKPRLRRRESAEHAPVAPWRPGGPALGSAPGRRRAAPPPVGVASDARGELRPALTESCWLTAAHGTAPVHGPGRGSLGRRSSMTRSSISTESLCPSPPGL